MFISYSIAFLLVLVSGNIKSKCFLSSPFYTEDIGLTCLPSTSKQDCTTLQTGKPKTDAFTSSENPYEIPQDTAFHQGLHCWLRQNRSTEFKKSP